jgi:hypothetical protein
MFQWLNLTAQSRSFIGIAFVVSNRIIIGTIFSKWCLLVWSLFVTLLEKVLVIRMSSKVAQFQQSVPLKLVFVTNWRQWQSTNHLISKIIDNIYVTEFNNNIKSILFLSILFLHIPKVSIIFSTLFLSSLIQLPNLVASIGCSIKEGIENQKQQQNC